MTSLIILGSANAIPTEEQNNTHFLLMDSERPVLIDCAPDVFLSCYKRKLLPSTLGDIIITHFHPDHVSGLPLLLMNTWLLGRTEPMTIHANMETIDRIQRMMELFDWDKWPDFFQVIFHTIEPKNQPVVIEEENYRIIAGAVKHLIPTIGLRFELSNGKVFAYSCDTEPCQSVIDLAKNADVFIHEAAGEVVGHSSIQQAVEDAASAECKNLYLIHYPPGAGELLKSTKTTYTGCISLAMDGMEFV
jgi:ribonuclease Z